MILHLILHLHLMLWIKATFIAFKVYASFSNSSWILWESNPHDNAQHFKLQENVGIQILSSDCLIFFKDMHLKSDHKNH